MANFPRHGEIWRDFGHFPLDLAGFKKDFHVFGEIRGDSAQIGHIFQDLAVFGQIWQPSARLGEIWHNLAQFGEVWRSLEIFYINRRYSKRDFSIFRMISQDLAGLNKIWRDLARFGIILPDLRRIDTIRPYLARCGKRGPAKIGLDLARFNMNFRKVEIFGKTD